MKFKEFVEWCNYRAFDGCWGMRTARFCISVIRTVRSLPFWKREKVWRVINAEYNIEKGIVEHINKKIDKMQKRMEESNDWT